MKKSEFQIGQTVTVIDAGCRYPNYSEMANKMGLTKWKGDGPIATDDIVKIVAVDVHPSTNKYLYGVTLPCGAQEIISEDGLELYADNCSSTIKISRDTLNSYWDAATTEQREYINKHFQLDGTTTVDAIKGLRDIACDKWKKIIMSNHPEVFPEHSKYFDLKGLRRNGADCFTAEELVGTGLNASFLQVANNALDSEYRNKGLYLSMQYNWEFHETEYGGWVVVPTKKGK